MSIEKIKGSNDLILFKPLIHEDKRGFFLERFNMDEFRSEIGTETNFIQINESFSSKGTLRGLHYQLESPQGKFVSVISGKVLDVVVDMRVNSSTFRKSFAIELDSKHKCSLWIPRGYAHGFLALTNDVTFFYMVDNIYNPSSEHTLLWSDPSLKIDWGTDSPLVSSKDKSGLSFENSPKFI